MAFLKSSQLSLGPKTIDVKGFTQATTLKLGDRAYTEHEVLLADNYNIVGDITVSDNLILSKLSDDGNAINITGDTTTRTITGSGSIEGATLAQTPNATLTGMTGVPTLGATFHQNIGQLYNFSGTINFDNVGAGAGYEGPILSQAKSSYTGEYLAGTWLNNVDYFNMIAGLQYFRIPKTGTWTYVVKGAKGGAGTHSGLGRHITSTATLYAGEWVKMLCGHQGSYSEDQSNGGGGGSFIAVARMGTWLPLLVSGGGAGWTRNSPNSTNPQRNAFAPGAGKGDAITAGGSGSWYNMDYPNHSSASVAQYWSGGGGGGWSSPGGDGHIKTPSAQLIGGRALGSVAPIGGLWSVTSGVHSGSGGSTVVNNGGFGGGGGSGHGGGAAGGGGGWWGGNATFSVSTGSDDTNHLGGGSHSMNSYTDHGTHTGGPGSVSLSL